MSKKNTSSGGHRILFSVLCLLVIMLSFANAPHTNVNEALQQQKKEKTKVYILHSDKWSKHKSIPGAHLLVGNVALRHDSMYMYCDSAHMFEETNSFEAFNNVRMEQGDTLFIYGDYLHYDGISQLAILRNNVRLINNNATLTTDSLNYDRLFNFGYYFEGGMLTDESNVLTSDWGEYSPATKLAVFNHEVVLTNPQFVLYSDTLKYSTETKIATILGPSDIESDANHIYSELGIYDTDKGEAELLNRSVLTNEGKRLIGDSLYYNRTLGFGEAFDNVVMNDTVNRSMLTGDYCYYNERQGSALATRRAVAIDYSQGDSLFMHADTLKMVSFNYQTDSVIRELQAYHKVRVYRTDIQAVCDSLTYNTKDSCLAMYHDPIVWNGPQQLLGEEIRVYMNDSTIDWAHIINQALTLERKDAESYNQVTGKEMKAYFKEGDIREVEVTGNVKVVYYIEEDDGTLMVMNVSETSTLNMYLQQRQVEKILMTPQSNGTAFPMDQRPPDKMYLSNFAWFDYIRPLHKNDIFEWRGKKAGDELKKSTRKPVTSPSRELVKPL